jgi:hypothetical protein
MSSPVQHVGVVRHLQKSCKNKNNKNCCDRKDCARHTLVPIDTVIERVRGVHSHDEAFHWYEHFNPDDKVCLCYDFDNDWGKELRAPTDKDTYEQRVLDFRRSIIPVLLGCLGKHGVREDAIAITDSSGFKTAPNKMCYVLSMHVVINSLCCTYKHSPAVLQRLEAGHDPLCPVRKHVDLAIFKPDGFQLRMVGASCGKRMKHGVEHYTDTRALRMVTCTDNVEKHIVSHVADAKMLDDAYFGLAAGTLDTDIASNGKRAAKPGAPCGKKLLTSLPEHVQDAMKEFGVERLQNEAQVEWVATGHAVVRIGKAVPCCYLVPCDKCTDGVLDGEACPSCTHSGNSNYFWYDPYTDRLQRKCWCEKTERCGRACAPCHTHAPVEVALTRQRVYDYGYFTQHLCGKDNKLEETIAYCASALAYVDTMNEKGYYVRHLLDDSTPTWLEYSGNKFSSTPFSCHAHTDKYYIMDFATPEQERNAKKEIFRLEICELDQKIAKVKTSALLKKRLKAEQALAQLDKREKLSLAKIVLQLTDERRIRWYTGTTWLPYLVGAPNPPAIRNGYLNTFAGFRTPYTKISAQDMRGLEGGVLKTFLHVLDNLVNGENSPAHVKYHRQFIAHIFQKAHIKPPVELCYIALEGIGKDACWRAIMAALGSVFCAVNNIRDRITDQFNGWMEGKLIVLNTDMGSSGRDTQLTDAKKSYVSDSDIMIRKLYKEGKKVPTFMRWVSLNNPSMNGSRAGTGRRDNTVSCGPKLDRSVYDELFRIMMPDGTNYDQAFLRDLALYFYNVDIDGFRPQGFPFTRQHRAQAWYSNAPGVSAIRAVIYVLAGEQDADVHASSSYFVNDERLLISGKKLFEVFLRARGNADKEAVNYERFREIVCKTFACQYKEIKQLRGTGATNTRGFTVHMADIENAIHAHLDKNYASERLTGTRGQTHLICASRPERAIGVISTDLETCSSAHESVLRPASDSVYGPLSDKGEYFYTMSDDGTAHLLEPQTKRAYIVKYYEDLAGNM